MTEGKPEVEKNLLFLLSSVAHAQAHQGVSFSTLDYCSRLHRLVLLEHSARRRSMPDGVFYPALSRHSTRDAQTASLTSRQPQASLLPTLRGTRATPSGHQPENRQGLLCRQEYAAQ